MARVGGRSPANLSTVARRGSMAVQLPPVWSPVKITEIVKSWRTGPADERFPLMKERRRASSFDNVSNAMEVGLPVTVELSAAGSRDEDRRRLCAPLSSEDSAKKARIEASAARKRRGQWGLYAQYFAVGVVYGGLPSTIYGFFLGYLNVESYVYATTSTIVALPWSFKFAFGAVNDCVPIFGYRRKPYIVIGWTICTVALLVLAQRPLPAPYWCDETVQHRYTKAIAASGVDDYHFDDDLPQSGSVPGGRGGTPCNPDAVNQGAPFAMLMMLASFGYCIADVAADGLTVTLARAEALKERGQSQTSVYMVRSLGNIVAVAVVGICMNSRQYNGSFDWGLSFSQMMGLFAVVSMLMVPISWRYIDEPRLMPADDLRTPHISRQRRSQMGRSPTPLRSPGPQDLARAQLTPNLRARVHSRVSFRQYARSVWALLRSRAMLYCILYQFLTPLISGIFSTAGAEVKQHWAGVRVLQNAGFSLVGLVLFTFGLYLVKTKLLDRSWRSMMLITTILLNVLDMPFAFLTIFGVVRNQYFYLGEAVLTEIPAAVNFVVATFVIVEMAEGGDEGIVYGLLTTTYNLGSPFAQAISNQIFGLFTPRLSDSANYLEDTHSFRRTVALSFALSYGFAFLSLCTLPLLPNQKDDAQRRKREWESRDAYAYFSIGLVSVGLVYSFAVNIMAISPSTSCMRIVGGGGCHHAYAATDDGRTPW